MADRCALLKGMKQRVNERGIIQKKYFDGERCCVVGYGLTELGMTPLDLIALSSASIDNVYGDIKTSLYGVPCYIWNKAHALVRESGVSQEEWGELQEANDWKGTEVLLDILDGMLDRSDCK